MKFTSKEAQNNNILNELLYPVFALEYVAE